MCNSMRWPFGYREETKLTLQTSQGLARDEHCLEFPKKHARPSCLSHLEEEQKYKS